MHIERSRENVFTVTATSQELSASVAGARMALVEMRSAPEPPPPAEVEVLERVRAGIGPRATIGVMRTASHSNDDRLLARLNAPPDLSDGVQSLAYWRERRQRLSWHRILARREAARMTVRWEQRVGSALVSQRGAPIAIRVSAGLLVARTRLRRWSGRVLIVMTGLVIVTLMAAPVLASVVLLTRLVGR